MKKNIVKSLLCAGLLVALAACGGSAKVDLKENIEIEYGSDPKIEDLTNQEGIRLKEIKEYDAKKIGEQRVNAVFIADEKEIEQEVTVTVKDTKAPEIVLKSETVEITLGDEIDTASNIESVKDPVDGDITQSTDNTISEDGYYVTADIKSEAGEYTVTVTAYDKNGNKTEKSYQLVIKEKSQETASTTQPQQQSQGSYQTPQNNQSGGSNTSGTVTEQPTPEPSQPKVTCPNGNEPQDPSLPCDAFVHSVDPDIYRDASGNIVTFPTAEAAYDWAWDKLLNDRTFTREYGYSSFVTTPLLKNDGTECDGIVFE